jgi:hypothetical protein
MIPRTWSTLIALLVGAAAIVWAAPRFNEVRSRMRDQDAEIRGLTKTLLELRTVQDQRLSDEAHWRNEVVQDWQGVLNEWEVTLTEARAAVERSGTDLADLSTRLDANMAQVEGLKSSVATNADHLANLSGPAAALLRDRILHPVFQIDAEESVGSAVLVWRGEDAAGPYYLALSAQHVLRDLVPGGRESLADAGANGGEAVVAPAAADLAEVDIPCVFDQLGPEPVRVTGRLLAENVLADLALLELRTEQDLGAVARLAPRAAAARVNSFTPIWTVGCPLGTTAQATRGEVTRTDWKVGSQPYWMVSSPAYFGNSGGGVFLADSLELIGVFSKIYTHGSYRPQVVTHMGLAVPLDVLHDWLAEIGYEFLTPAVPR